MEDKLYQDQLILEELSIKLEIALVSHIVLCLDGHLSIDLPIYHIK